MTDESIAAILLQHDHRLTVLETSFNSGLSLMKWIGGGALTLLAALLGSSWIHL